MDDTPYVNDGADASLRKTVSLLNKIEAKTGSATITGAVTVNNEVEIKNTENNPIPVSDNGGSLTVDGTVSLSPDSLSALENIQVTFPSTQNVSVQNTSLAVTGTFFQATQPVSANALPLPSGASTENTLTGLNTKIPSNLTVSSTRLLVDGSGVTQPVSDNGGSLTVDGTITAAQATAANLNATVVGSGSFTAAQATASALKAQAQLLNASGSVVDYAMTGTAGTPASDVVTIQGIVGGTTVPVSLASVPSHPVTGPLTNTELRTSAVPVSLASVPSHPVTGPLTNTELRATAVQVSGTVTANTGLTQPLTDTQLRATAVPISGTVTSRLADGTGNNLTSAARGSERALSVQIVDASGAQVTSFGGGGGGGAGSGLTDAELRATAVPVSLASAPTTPVTDNGGSLTVDGSVSVSNFPATQTISDKGATGESSVTSFTSTSSAVLKASNANRKLLTVFNEGTGTIFILLGSGTASTTNYSLRLLSGDYYELEKYTGEVNAIFSSAGTAKITEIT